MAISQSASSRTRQDDNLGERANVKLALLCPVCRSREALLRYSRKDSPYIVCDCGIRMFIWDTEAKQLMLKRVSDYKNAKSNGRLEEYKKSQMLVR